MTPRAFKQVDVFTDTPYLGNPLAVVLDGTGLDDGQMQHFAAWTNLSETTFVLPPSPQAAALGADYRVRIFTTAYEMPFAGHPTLGSCHAWLAHGGQPKDPACVVQECQVGLVRIRQDGPHPAFAAPALTRSAPTPEVLAQLTHALGLQQSQVQAAQHLTNGPHHFGVLLDHADTVLGMQPNLPALRQWLQSTGVSGVGVAALDTAQPNSGLIKRSNREARAFSGNASQAGQRQASAQLEVRFFANDVMVIEDPVTGSFNASLAQWLMAEGLAPESYTATQGTCLGRHGQVHLSRDSTGQVWVGGDSVTCIDGVVTL